VALQGFDGALLLVSHDRHMLRNTVEELLLVHDGQVEEYREDLNSYEKWILASYRAVKSGTDAATDTSRKERRQQAAAQREQLRPLKKQLAKLETAMGKLNKTLGELQSKLADPDLYTEERKDELAELLRLEGEAKGQAEVLEEDWLNRQHELEELEQALAG
jgi:ATP-binding cassette subfamily F protein 3